MPLTPFQRSVLRLLKGSRNPESYVAGGAVIQRHADSVRYSDDIDFFHDTDAAVVAAYESDRATLLAAKFTFQTHLAQPSFYRATIAKGQERLKLEWARDTAYRFFPVIEDEDFGYRLHDVDLAVNKCLALANRAEIRDALDILAIDAKVLSLAGCIWAACGKDPGFTPELMLELIQRHASFPPTMLAAEFLSRPVDPKRLKTDLMRLLQRTHATLAQLDPQDLGCLYLDQRGNVIRELRDLDRRHATPHYGSVRGSWPRIAT